MTPKIIKVGNNTQVFLMFKEMPEFISPKMASADTIYMTEPTIILIKEQNKK